MAYTESTKRIRASQLVVPAQVVASANGPSVDLKGTVNPGQHEHRVHVNIGVVTGTSPTNVVKMQDSPDNSTWTDIAGATTATLTVAGVTDFYFRTPNRYVRAVMTVTGTSPVFPMAVDLYSTERNV